MSTFYDNYIKLCAAHDKSPTAVSKEIGLSNAAASGWKNGKKPSAVTKQKLADYFGVTVEELTGESEQGKSEQKEKPSTVGEIDLSGLSSEDAELVQKILNASEAKKNAIRELL